jgi:hypothetical protein
VLFNYNFFLCIEVEVNNGLKMVFSTICKKYETINLLRRQDYMKNRNFKKVNGKKYF